MSPPVLAIVARKGGVGKTTTACELAMAVSAHGLRVLVIDYDESANATSRLGVTPEAGLASLVMGRPDALSLAELSVPSPWREDGRLSVVPSADDLAAVVSDPRPAWPMALRNAIAKSGDIADLIIIDTGPSRTRHGYQARVAADYVLTVTTGEEDSVNAIASAIDDTVEVAESGLVPGVGPAVIGIVASTALSLDGAVRMAAPRELVTALQDAYGDLMWSPLIPRLDAVMAEVRRRQISTRSMTDASRIAEAYDALAVRLIASSLTT